MSSLLWGIEDSVSPFSLTNLLIFIFLLFQFSKSRRWLVIFGFVFIVFIFIFKYLLFFGFFDLLPDLASIEFETRVAFFIVAVTMIVYGMLCFFDWVRLKRKKGVDFLINKWPILFYQVDHTKNQKRPWWVWLWKIIKGMAVYLIIPVVFALLMTAGESLWPQSYLQFAKFYKYSTTNNSQEAHISLFIYILGFCMLYIISWGSSLYIKRHNEQLSSNLVFVAFTKIIMSALFLSVGVGLILARYPTN